MNLLAKGIFSIFVIFISCVFAGAQNSWTGIYEFDEDGGKTAGGTPIYIAHQMEIKKTGDRLLATIRSNGYQTSIDLIGTAQTDGEKLLIFFDSYGENNVFDSYEQGDLLLTLEKKSVKDRTEILTFWNKFRPVVPKNEKSGKVYFKKSAEPKQ